MGEIRNAYTILFGHFEGQRSLEDVGVGGDVQWINLITKK
jgi:hypothetical protein